MALLAAAGLFVKSLTNVSRVDLGVKIDRVVTFGISPELNGYSPARSKVFFAQLEEALAAIPGVDGVSASLVAVFSNSSWGSDVVVQGFKHGPDIDANSRMNEVGPGYFRTLGMPLVAGREFTNADAVGSPKVVIVNEAFTKKFNLGRDAIGKFMGANGSDSTDMQIVGVVRDAKYDRVKREAPPIFIIPYRQDSTIGYLHFYVRTSGDPAPIVRAIPGVVRKLDPNLPVESLKTMTQQVKENVYLDRMISILSAGFALLATLLAAVGLYGVLAYSVAQRTREIGVRMALGADGSVVRRMVLRQVGMMTLVGGVIGIIAALGVGRWATSLLFQLEGHDPVVLVTSATVLAIVALAAGYVPALRASRIDPMQALRYE
jgi:predicted permease